MNLSKRNDKVTVSAPSRIHFGLFSIGTLCDHEFGGVGLMLDHPRTRISIEGSDQSEVITNDPETTRRVSRIVQQWQVSFGSSREGSGPAACRIEVDELPPAHVGLGSGTQLAMAIMYGLSVFFADSPPSIDELIRATQRAKRSAIGSHGFLRGGLLIDRGRAPDGDFAPLDFQDAFPDWPIVLAVADSNSRVFGAAEVAAFKNLPPTLPETREAMVQIVKNQMLPALMQRDYPSFAESVFQVGQGSGKLFESIQGGIYNGPQVTQLVTAIREFGIPAVGQSSWGPCVFAITRDIDTASELMHFLTAEFPNCQVRQTTADNRGVRLEKVP